LCAGALSAGAQAKPEDSPQPAKAGPTPAAPSTVAERRFDIMEYVVDGNSVLSVPDIEEAVYPYLGESRTADDVDKARKALEDVYQSRGYQSVQVSIPQQGVDNGIIHLQVTENPVGRLRVVNSKYHLPSEIKGTAPSLAEGKVVNVNDVQNDIVALNQQPGMKVTPQLKAGKAPGTVDVDLEVEDSPPLHANVEINNEYNQSTEPLRVIGSLSYDNLWGLGHSISASYQIAPQNPSDAKVFSGTYLAHIPDTPVSILAYGVSTDSDVAALAGTDVIGRGNIAGVRAILNLPDQEGFFQSITAGFDRKDLTQNVVTLGIPTNAPVLYYPVTLAYHGAAINGDPKDGGSETDIDASFNFAIPGIGSDSTKFDPQRVNALKEYFYFKAGVSRTQPLPYGMVLYAKADGQMTGDSLLSSEQLSAGGESSVRGYLEAERIGDYGVRSTLELRSPSFGTAISPKINEWRVLAFFDAAGLWLRNPLVGEQSSYTLAGIGIGTRLVAFDNFNAAFDLAFPLLKGAVTKPDSVRVHFKVSSGF
jgi:hemolysin activation/secretion protein